MTDIFVKSFLYNLEKSALEPDLDTELDKGIKVESEHTDTIKKIKDNPSIKLKKVQEMIAMDHIYEKRDYYDLLSKCVEKKSEINKEGSRAGLAVLAMLSGVTPSPLKAQLSEGQLNLLKTEMVSSASKAHIGIVKDILKMVPGEKIPSDTSLVRVKGIEVTGNRLFKNMVTEINKVKPQNQEKAYNIAKDIFKKLKTAKPGIGTKVDVARKFLHFKGL